MRGVDYPFGAPAEPGVLAADGGWSPLAGPADTDDRTAVVAVGSNAVPAVVHAKLRAAGVGGAVPFATTQVRGVGVAHSAHVSPGGYVPVTAHALPDAALVLVASWFLPEQLAALDATEPNYVRVPLPVAAPPGATVYASRWGVLAPDGAALLPTTQAEVHWRLRADPDLADWLPGDADAVVEALRDPGLAERVRDRLAALGWTRPTGLPPPTAERDVSTAFPAPDR